MAPAKGSPYVYMILGTLFGAFAIVGLTVDVFATEYTVTGRLPNLFNVAALFTQPVQFINGELSLLGAIAFFVGFGLEAAYLACFLHPNMMSTAMKGTHSFLVRMYQVGQVVLLIYQAISDYRLVLFIVEGDWVKALGVTLFIIFVVLVFTRLSYMLFVDAASAFHR